VVLQVEDDSNLIAFGNGFDNQSLLVHAQLNHSRQRRLVRTHPGSQFALRPGPYVVDESPNSIEFIQRCRRLLTINSSVGLEALLLDVSVKTLGDCSYRHVAEAEAHEQSGRLAHYLFAYLVPMDLIFSPAYLRFRLANPGEDQIVLRHIAAYLGNRAVAESAQTAMEAIAAVLPADGFSAS
jgi:capsule polysaccharide modification protein KpsS